MSTEIHPATREKGQSQRREPEATTSYEAILSRPRSGEIDTQSDMTCHPNAGLEELHSGRDHGESNLLVEIVGKPSIETVRILLDQLCLRDQDEDSEKPDIDARAHIDDPTSPITLGAISVVPATTSFETDSVTGVGAETALTELDVSVNSEDLRRMSDAQREPFPDYFESCEKNTTGVNGDHEAAYNYAISKVVEEVIRFREVDSSISSLPILNEKDRSLDADEQNDNDEHENSSTCHRRSVAERAFQKGSEGGGVEHGRKSPGSHELIDELKDSLADTNLKPRLRRRFASMSNMVLHMHRLLFPTTSDGMPVQPTQFLSSKETIIKVNLLASEIIKYLASVDGQVQEQVDSASRVTYILEEVNKDRSVDVYVRYRRMAQVVIANVRKPRSIEERLLSLFLELYDAYVYSRFVRIRNRQIITESGLGPERLELSRLVIAIWDILNRIIENYAAHVHAMREMKRRFFAPAMEELRRSPHIWNESWKRFETMIRLDEEVDEKEEEEEARSSTCQVERRATGS